MKAQRGVELELYPLRTFALGGGWLCTQRSGYFTSGMEPRYPLYRRLSGLQDVSGRVWRRENFLASLGFEP